MITEVPVIPESAPFTTAQRAWLNGFFAGMFSRGPAPVTRIDTSATVVETQDEDMPWHDAALSMDERLALTDGKPKARRLMAAMAQLDCGACGYLCQTYAEAIANGDEKDINRCAPGGRDTSRKLKELLAVLPADQVTVKGAAVATPARPAGDRRHPVAARLLKSECLNSSGSSKDTRHVVFDLHGTGLSYKAGDALGVMPENCADTVAWVMEAIDASGAEMVTAPDSSEVSLQDALLRHFTITQPSSDLVELLAEVATDPSEKQLLRAMVDENGPGIPEGVEVLDLLRDHRSARPDIARFIAALRPLRVRLYSISSSQLACPDEVHLTVGTVRFLNLHGRQCKGVASTYLAERLRPGQKAKIYVQPAHGFGPPADGNTPMIMVGPGTGIAPFRAFLQERVAMNARGKNWLFFGDQRRDQDFLYQAELDRYMVDGVLTRLDTAFSRDQDRKVYVQNRMIERSAEIWSWLQEGAHFYVCGDAKRMANDVDLALKQIIAEQGKLSAEQAAAYVSEMTKSKRYQRDVY